MNRPDDDTNSVENVLDEYRDLWGLPDLTSVLG